MILVHMKNVSKKGQQVKLPLIYFLQKSGKQHNKLKVDLQKNFTKYYDWYPKNIKVTLMILDKYTKSSVIQQTTSQLTLYAQRGGYINK